MTRTAPAYLLVRAGGRRVGLPLASVVEVLQPGPCYPVPTLEPAVRGVTTVRGRILPVVSLTALLAESIPGPAETALLIVMDLDGRRLCLEVDDAEEVLRGAGLPVPQGGAMPWAAGVARHGGKLVPLLDLTALGARILEGASA